MLARRSAEAWFAAGITIASCLPALAAEPAARGASAPSDAQAWLLRIHGAASQRNYQGTLVISAGGTVSSSRVTHFADGAQQFERVEALDGERREMLRTNDTVQTYWPRWRVVLVEARDPRASFPALLSGDGPVLDSYELRQVGADRVAGYDADVLWLKARDELRFSQKLWAERATGLLLRSEVVAVDGQVLESSTFSQVAIGVKPQPGQLQDVQRKMDGYRVVQADMQATDLVGEGWALNAPLPRGFRQVSCFRRAWMPGADRATPVLQSIFSDGLTHVSVFIEPYQSSRHHGMRALPVGSTHTVIHRLGDYWITVMGDVPLTTLERFAAALSRRTP